MIHLILFTLFCTMLGLAPHRADARLHGHTMLVPRSQSTNSARHAAMWHNNIYRAFADDTWHGGFAITTGYNASFRERRLAEYYFGTNVLGISGSEVTTRGESDILADYFGLSPSFASTVIVSPFLSNTLLEGSFQGSYNAWYFQAHLPVVHATTRIDLCETIESTTEVEFPADYMSVAPLTPPFHSFTKAIEGKAGFGQIERRTNGNILRGTQDKTGLSDPLLFLGYAILQREHAFLGLHAILGIPTGNRPTSTTLLQPIIGNGRHWELGLGLASYWAVWEKAGEQAINLVVDINATHLFNARQRRSFDFCVTSTCDINACGQTPCDLEARSGGGFGSRYMLVKEFDSNKDYNGTSLPGINLSTLWCDVRTGIQIDSTFLITYQYRKLAIDFGYNGWLRTNEKISNIEPCPCSKTVQYGFKGVQNAVNNETQSTANLHGNFLSTDPDERAEQQAMLADPTTTTFTNCCLNVCSAAAPHTFTHKFFGSVAHAPAWYEVESRGGLIGIGAEVEFESIRPRDMQPDEVAISQWGVWAKIGYIW